MTKKTFFCINFIQDMQLPLVLDNFFHLVSRHNYNTRLASRSSYCVLSVWNNLEAENLNICYQDADIWNKTHESSKRLTFQRFKNIT